MILIKNKLEIPCTYQGGKQRIAKDIVDIFFKENIINKETKFYDLCCGSGAISIELVNRGIKPENITMLDTSPWGMFWEMIGNGSFDINKFKNFLDTIPKDITKIKNYAKEILSQPANIDTVYRFLFLQACSFGGTPTWIENNKWIKNGGLRNYWLPTETSNRRSPVNPMMPMPNTLLARVKNISLKMYGVNGIHDNIENFVEFSDNSIIYIDPPYNNSHGYGYNFDLSKYISKLNIKNKIYISEGFKMFDKGYLITGVRRKGGVNGNRKSRNEEWLNVYEGGCLNENF